MRRHHLLLLDILALGTFLWDPVMGMRDLGTLGGGESLGYQSVDKVQSKHRWHSILDHFPTYPPIYGMPQVISEVYQRAVTASTPADK